MTRPLDLLVAAGVVILALLWLVRRWRRTLRNLKTPTGASGCPGCSGCSGCPGCGPRRPADGMPGERPAARHEKPTNRRDDTPQTLPETPRRSA